MKINVVTTFLFRYEGGNAVLHLRTLLLAPDLPHHQHESTLHVDCIPEVSEEVSKHDKPKTCIFASGQC